MSVKVVRPQADPKRKVLNKNDFELCYLRHQYLRRVEFNPTDEQMKPYYGINLSMSKNTYYTYRNLFGMVGFELDDIINIGKVHIVNFLGLFSLEQQPDKFVAFEKAYQLKNLENINDFEVLKKNRANFSLFLKQRMEDVVRVCRLKARNIKGRPTDEFQVFVGPNKPPHDPQVLFDKFEELGYRKIDSQTFKALRKRFKRAKNQSFKAEGQWYVLVPYNANFLTEDDLDSSEMGTRDSIHNMNPEQILTHFESEVKWEQRKDAFDGHSDYWKIRKLKNFISLNAKNPLFAEEVRTARRLVKKLKGIAK